MSNIDLAKEFGRPLNPHSKLLSFLKREGLGDEIMELFGETTPKKKVVLYFPAADSGSGCNALSAKLAEKLSTETEVKAGPGGCGRVITIKTSVSTFGKTYGVCTPAEPA